MRFIVVIMLLVSVTACASKPKKVIPELENRTLLISPDGPGLYYQWKECVKPGIFGGCREEKMTTEFYDLRDEVTRKKLRDFGFEAYSERRLQPK